MKKNAIASAAPKATAAATKCVCDQYYIYHKIVKRRFGDAANSDTNPNKEK